jgi:hypothetical protein
VATTFEYAPYAKYGDEELRCLKAETPIEIELHPELDWAAPGSQNSQKHDPE